MAPDSDLDGFENKVKDAARELYSILGGGYLESVYEEAMAIELRERKITYGEEQGDFLQGHKGGHTPA